MGENTAVKWVLFFFFPALFIYGLLHVYSSKPAQAKRTAELTAEEEAGRKVYNKFCVGCHGVNGDGNSEAAKFFKTNHQTSTQLYSDGNLHLRVHFQLMTI